MTQARFYLDPVQRCASIVVRVALAGVSVGAGCARVESDFLLQLEPRTPVDQRPFDRGPSIKLVVRERLGTDIVPLGAPRQRTVDAEGLGPLVDARVGIALELPTDDSTRLLPERLLAYGEAGPYTLSVDDEVLSEAVLVAEFGRVGGLDVLPDARFGAAVALTDRGDVVLFGGVDDLAAPQVSDQVLTLEDLDNGDWRFQPSGLLPEVAGAAARYAATASRVTWEGDPVVFVAGGRTDAADPLTATTTAVLWDPVAGLPVWSGDILRVPRSDHAAVTLENGRVLLVGGDRDTTTGEGLPTASFEVFDPSFLATSLGQQALDVPSTHFAISDLGPDGVLLCGGSVPIPGGAAPSDACARVSVLANVQTAASLPTAVHFAAMAPVGDGLVLLCGGAPGTISGSGTVPATTEAWLYDPSANTWTRTGDLVTARALHAVIPTPDGRAIVVGGVDSAGLGESVGDAVDCVEVFDPATGTFTETQCTGNGAGAWPGVSWTPTDGAFVLSGRDVDGVGGRSYGIVGIGPDL